MLTEITDDEKKVKHTKIYFIVIIYDINNLPLKAA